MENKQAKINFLLKLGDLALIHGHKLSEWCGKGPILEEDLALTNISLDHIGRAQAWLQYAGELEGIGRTADDLAYRRDERSYYNPLMAELPNRDFAFTMARIFLLSTYEILLYAELAKSEDKQIAAIASKCIKESKYHYSHSSLWVQRLGNGTIESKNRLQNGINDLWMYTGELFENDDDQLVDLSLLKEYFYAEVNKVLTKSGVIIPSVDYMQTGSRKGIHTEYLGHILSEMQYLQRAYPDAKW